MCVVYVCVCGGESSGLLTAITFSLALCFCPFPLVVSSLREHVKTKSDPVTLLFKTPLCPHLSKIKILIVAYNTLHHLHPQLPLWPRLLRLRRSFTALQSYLPPCCSLNSSNVFCPRAFPLALPETFFLTLLNGLFPHLLQISALTLLEKPFLTILSFIYFMFYFFSYFCWSFPDILCIYLFIICLNYKIHADRSCCSLLSPWCLE